MAKKTPPFKNYPKWTAARFWGFVRSALRQASSRYPPKYELLQSERRPYEGPNRRAKWMYKCNACKRWYQQKEVSVDHIVPVGTLKDYDDLAGFVDRLFCGTDGLQILCTTCHQEKTNEERNG